MKYLMLVSLLFLVGCGPSKEFKYGDVVTVKRGFYKDTIGRVVNKCVSGTMYVIQLTASDSACIDPEYLELALNN